MDDGDEGMELECDEDGGVSKRGKDESNGSFSLRSVSQSIKFSSSVKLMTFFASSASIISSDVVCPWCCLN